MEAGKHLYLEKPATHSLAEGPAILEAWQGSGLVVEVGTQRRSHPGVQEAIAALHSGEIGDVVLARCFSWKRRPPIGPEVRGRWPRTLDPDLWFGPRDVHRPTRQRFHYDWHWFTEFGNGGLGNNGVHRLDVARWGDGPEWHRDRRCSASVAGWVPRMRDRPRTPLSPWSPSAMWRSCTTSGDCQPARCRGWIPPTRSSSWATRDPSSSIARAVGSWTVTGGRFAPTAPTPARWTRSPGTSRASSGPCVRGTRARSQSGSSRGWAPPRCVTAQLRRMPRSLKTPARWIWRRCLTISRTLCGPRMRRPARDFLAHVRAHSGERQLAYSGMRSIVGAGVQGAPEAFDYRAGFDLPV